MRQTSFARWHTHCHAHLSATPLSTKLRDWLTLHTSLTAALQQHCTQFSIRRLHQHTTICLSDESQALGIPPRHRVQEREVLLCCDGVPVVFAHTVMPHTNTHADWPNFHHLGERSLGTVLFDDPLVIRKASQFCRLPFLHPLARRIYSAIPSEQIESRLHARRCLFHRKRGRMLVTEVFLSGMANLNQMK